MRDFLLELLNLGPSYLVVLLLGAVIALLAALRLALRKELYGWLWETLRSLLPWSRKTGAVAAPALEQPEEDFQQPMLHECSSRLRLALESERRVWQLPADPVNQDTPFCPLSERQAVIIAVVNLKGGVGKSTITANLGATQWCRQRDVLAVDLDFQSTLTSLCIKKNEMSRMDDDKYVDHIFSDPTADVHPHQVPIAAAGDRRFDILPARERLIDDEHRAMLGWIVRDSVNDVRFKLRSALHSSGIQSNYHYILLDCPPRLSAATINALACCDYVLIPTQIEAPSLNRVSPLVRWLHHFRDADLCSTRLGVGVVANAVPPRAGLSTDDDWRRMLENCARRWGDNVHEFKAAVPHREDFNKAARNREPLVIGRHLPTKQELREVFDKLAVEIEAEWS